jgi:all-trans-8'-apo-beta-carotenal 15,15'-oxygenase
LKHFPVVHSWVLTKHYYVFVNGPVEIDAWKSLTRRLTGAGLDDVLLPVKPGPPELHNKDAYTTILLVPRPQSIDATLNALAQAGEVNCAHKVLYADPCFVYHHVNGFEVVEEGADGSAVGLRIDSLAFDHFCPLDIYREGHDGRNGKLVRFHIDPNAAPKAHVKTEILCKRCAVMPTYKSGLDTKEHRFVYLVDCDKEPYTGILKYDTHLHVLQVHRLNEHQYTQEAIFVPRPNPLSEDDGWLLNMVLDGRTQKSFLQIMDAGNIENGSDPILAKVHLKTHVPYSFHASFHHQFMWNDIASPAKHLQRHLVTSNSRL